jgi:hypothetical protein
MFLRILIGTTAVVGFIACSGDVRDAAFTSYEEALASGAVEQGWVPTWVPRQATEIREVHNIDTNERALSFVLPPGLQWTPPAPCRQADGGEFSEPAFSRAWLAHARDDYSFFSCPSGVISLVPAIEAVAVSKDGQQVLNWSVFSR